LENNITVLIKLPQEQSYAITIKDMYTARYTEVASFYRATNFKALKKETS